MFVNSTETYKQHTMSFLLALSVFFISFAHLSEGAVYLSLGRCETFSVLSAAGITFAGRQTTIHTGNLGVSPGTSVTGNNLLLNGSTEINSKLANGCQADLLIAYNIAMAAVCPASNIVTDLAGMTLFPGVYCSNGGISISASSLTLDGRGINTAQWIFQAASTLITATSTSLVFQDGARPSNTFWALGTAATIGLSSSMSGNILAGSAITFGHDSSFTGRALAMTAVTFESGSTVILPLNGHIPVGTSVPRSPGIPSLKSNVAILEHAFIPTVPLGNCSTFALEAGSAMTFDGPMTSIHGGSIGVSPGSSIQGNVQINDGSVEITSSRSNQCADDRITAYNAAAAAPCSSSNIRSELSGLTLGPGVYCSGGAMTLSAGALTLDAGWNRNAEWVFQMASTLITSPDTSVILLNGALVTNVYWNVGSSATIAYSSSFIGTIIAYASITFGHDSVLTGRGLAGAGVTFEGGSSVYMAA